MPRFDGTGPRGEGPFTGRGAGYCAVAVPPSGQPFGYAGLQGTPLGRRTLGRNFRRPRGVTPFGRRGECGRRRMRRW